MITVTTVIKPVAAAFLVLVLIADCSGDLRVRIKETRDLEGKNFDNHTSWLFKGRRSRSDQNNLISIYQCDLVRAIYADDELRRYEIEDATEQAKRQPAIERFYRRQEREAREKRAGGTITITTRVEDTGERREMFGYTARRIKTTQLLQTSPDACSQATTRREIDGWYADLLYGLGCSADISGKNLADEELGYIQSSLGMLGIPDPQRSNVFHGLGLDMPYRITKDCFDRVIVERNGSARLGFPLAETATEHMSWYPWLRGTGQSPQLRTIKREVVELNTSELDPALFEIPAGYKRVKRGKLHD